jgi:hypothetical protein
MSENKGRGKGKGEGGGKRRKRAKDRHFMDAALDAYIRDQALLLWRDFVVYRDREGKAPQVALREAGFFGDRGEYEALWSGHWQGIAMPAADKSDGEIFGQIEAAVRAAVLEEKAARKDKGGEAFEDTEDYNAFVRQTLNQLLKESSAESEG